MLFHKKRLLHGADGSLSNLWCVDAWNYNNLAESERIMDKRSKEAAQSQVDDVEKHNLQNALEVLYFERVHAALFVKKQTTLLVMT